MLKQTLQIQKKKINWFQVTLILQYCLPIGSSVKFTSQRVNQYLLGSKNLHNVWKYEIIKHLLLKLNPFMHSLFNQDDYSTAPLKKKIKITKIPPIPPRDPTKLDAWKLKMRGRMIIRKHKTIFFDPIEKKKATLVLFATTTPNYKEIIKEAAESCQMSSSTLRWWDGFLTANFISRHYLRTRSLNSNDPCEEIDNIHFDRNFEVQQLEPTKLWIKLLPIEIRYNWQEIWSKLNLVRKFSKNCVLNHKIQKNYLDCFKINKDDEEKFFYWHRTQKRLKRPAIMIIPDIESNLMILKETVRLHIPIISIVNSNSSINVNYPIFGNTSSIKLVYFFLMFLARLIENEALSKKFKETSIRIFTQHFAINLKKNKKILNPKRLNQLTTKKIVDPKIKSLTTKNRVDPKIKTVNQLNKKKTFIHSRTKGITYWEKTRDVQLLDVKKYHLWKVRNRFNKSKANINFVQTFHSFVSYFWYFILSKEEFLKKSQDEYLFCFEFFPILEKLLINNDKKTISKQKIVSTKQVVYLKDFFNKYFYLTLIFYRHIRNVHKSRFIFTRSLSFERAYLNKQTNFLSLLTTNFLSKSKFIWDLTYNIFFNYQAARKTYHINQHIFKYKPRSRRYQLLNRLHKTKIRKVRSMRQSKWKRKNSLWKTSRIRRLTKLLIQSDFYMIEQNQQNLFLYNYTFFKHTGYYKLWGRREITSTSDSHFTYYSFLSELVKKRKQSNNYKWKKYQNWSKYKKNYNKKYKKNYNNILYANKNYTKNYTKNLDSQKNYNKKYKKDSNKDSKNKFNKASKND